MIKVYSIALAIGVVGLLVVIFGSVLASNLDRDEVDPNRRRGVKLGLGALLGFAMGGMAAEFSPIDLNWTVSLLLALVGGIAGYFWVRYSVDSVET